MRRQFVIVAIVGGTLLAGARARATCCNTGEDCPSGFACIGGACNATLVNCTCDTDCGPSLYCIPAVATVCTQEPGSTTQDCHPQGQCSSAWKRPCATDADCGPGGFTCVPNGRFCSGSDCQTTSTCTAPSLPTSCATNADCPVAWTCEPDTALATACVPVPPHSCPSGGCPTTTFTGAKSCLPPLFDLVGLGGFAGPPVVLPATCPAKPDSANGGAGPSSSAGGGSGTQHPGTTGPASGGCQVVPGGAEPTAFVLAALGLLGASLARRAKRPR